MLGGGKFPPFMRDDLDQYGNNTAPDQLQLVRQGPFINYVGNGQEAIGPRPVKRVREEENVYMKQRLGASLNNNESGHNEVRFNPYPVSTGLRLSREKEEGSSSITSASENIKTRVKMEMDELGQYIKLQEENIVKCIQELNQKHMISLLNALEKRVTKKLHEKEVEIQNINCKNKELSDRIKQVTMEAQSWHCRAKYHESIANGLKNNIQQLMVQGSAQGCEGSGESEVDDANSQTNQEVEDHRLVCRGCKGKRVSILLLPCRHLCLCGDCEGFIHICPICQVMKTASVLVFM